MLDFLSAVTGWDIDMNEALETGRRIQTLRQAFNIREGIEPSKMKLPSRMVGIPPMTDGPLAGITIDIASLAREYHKAMGWAPDTGYPTKLTLEELGLLELAKSYGTVV
jgi:aldehyde:ferredoxin oxidoreductase